MLFEPLASQRVRNLVPFSQMEATPERQIASHVISRRVPLEHLAVDGVGDRDRRPIDEERRQIGAGTVGNTVSSA
jgi:hypothetical protein